MNERLLRLLRAFDFSARKHRDQRRKDAYASPYINHPISVARVLAEVGNVDDIIVLMGAVLHDVLEDTDTSPEELEDTFGRDVRTLVEEVTDDKRLSKAERKRRHVERAPHLSSGAVLITLGDKISNIRDITHHPPATWSLARRREYLDWAESVIARCPKVNAALEEHFFQTLGRGRRVSQESSE